MFIGLRRLGSQDTRPPHFVVINGSPGVILHHPDGTISAMTFAFEANRVKAIYMVRNPDKLTALEP